MTSEISRFAVKKWSIRLAVIALIVGVLIYSQLPRDHYVAVGLTGVHHMGSGYHVSEFYVDKGYYGKISTGGGGGAVSCCVLIPQKWRPGIVVDVRWSLEDWSKRIPSETAAGNYNSLQHVGIYRAMVEVEKYQSAERLYVHIFADGKARVVSSEYYPESDRHPVKPNDDRAHEPASVGIRIGELLSKEELAYLEKKDKERKRKYGDWR